jgi:CRP/FNR family transcriptional regulator, cyclic AMP receptor protein
LVKLYKRDELNKEILFTIVAPGELFGEQALLSDGIYNGSAEVMEGGVIYVIPRDVLIEFAGRQPETWRLLGEFFVRRQAELEKKIEMLCLRDVEQRILYYLGELARLCGSRSAENGEYTINLTQGELASLIGATRETTSSTLNALSRRGLIHLRRRLIVVPALDCLKQERTREMSAASTGV